MATMEPTAQTKNKKNCLKGKMVKENVIKTVEQVTMTGKDRLNPDHIKFVKRGCKADETIILPLYEALMKQITKDHSEIRLSAFQLIVEIFERSHNFRCLVIDNFQELLTQILETDPSRSLPPPKEAKDKLTSLALVTVHGWVKKYGNAYRKLYHAYNFLRQVKKVSFNELDARTEQERQKEIENKRRKDNIWRERIKKVKDEIEDCLKQGEIENCKTQIENCLGLLIPSAEKFLFSDESSNLPDTDIDEPKQQQELDRENGVISGKFNLAVVIPSDNGMSPKNKILINEDNVYLVENLKDQYGILKSKILPKVKKWTITLGKSGISEATELLKKAIDIKKELENLENKVVSLDLDGHDINLTGSNSDTDESDLEEVPEKEGYEAFSNLDNPRKNNEEMITEKIMPSCSSTSANRTLFDGDMKCSDLKNDPTTFQATLYKMKNQDPGEPSVKLVNEDKIHPVKQNINSNIPKLPSDVDVNKWGENVKPTKILVRPDLNRVWGSAHDGNEIEIPCSSGTQRVIDFSGKFEPVTWTCRAPLPSGRLCPRKDRMKCPLHGPVIARDDAGLPSDKVIDDTRLSTENTKSQFDKLHKSSGSKDDWQDPELLEDIRKATDINLKVENRSRGKSSTKKYEGLSNITELQNTSRARLKKKVFNASAMKRVANKMNVSDSKKFKDKFADQFNYMFNQ